MENGVQAPEVSWLDFSEFVQCDRRHNNERTRFTSFIGFRLVAGMAAVGAATPATRQRSFSSP
jgi:hypothetical protein